MNCPSTEQWDLLSMNLASRPDEADLLAHAQGCDACRAALMQARRDHALLLQGSEMFHRRHDCLRNELMAAVPAELPPRTPRPRGGRRSLLDFVPRLDTPARRVVAVLAPAACILIVVGILLTPGESAVAFAEVLERMRQAKTMVCDFTTVSTMVFEADHRTEERAYHGKLSTYSDGDMRAWRMDQTDPPSTQWTFPDHSVNIDADGKRTVIRFAEHPNPYARCESPEWWPGRLLKLTEASDRELGQEMLDGRQVVGFEIAGWKLGYGARPTPGAEATTAPVAVVRLWVDARTGLPVRMHVEDVMAMRMPGICSTRVSMTWERIEWDMPLDPQAFQPPPPVAGAPVEEMDINGTEEGLLNGLRAYAAAAERVTGGRFADLPPDTLEEDLPDGEEGRMAREVMEYLREFLHGYPKELDVPAIQRLSIIAPNVSRGKVIAARATGDAEAIARAEEEAKALLEELIDVTRQMGAPVVFHSRLLAEGREPEYFGATVNPGDSETVLMRWKLDDDRWRVIYGDLRAETMPMSKPASGDVSPES